MGVQGLWELLAPVGRRVSVEVLGGRKLAIDASIWIIQFMKAMRDDKGDMIRNAHLLGFFRRICKLLYLRVKPVFVFDGGTPALKRRTVIARRRQRERAQSKIRKTAEKLLLNHLRTRRLDEIAKNIGLVHPEKNIEIPMDTERTEGDVNKDASNQNRLCQDSQETAALDDGDDALEKVSAYPLGEEDETLDFNTSEKNISADSSDEDNECMFIPPAQGRVDPAVLASLPPSMQLNLLVQMREQLVADNRKKFQKVAKDPASFSQLQIQAYLKTVAFRRDIDEVQKAAAGKGIGGIPTSRIASEANREFIFSSSFKREIQRDEIDKEEPIDATKDDQEDAIFSENGQLTGNFPLNQVQIASDASQDNDIEWENEDDFTTAYNQPINGVTIEIDENDLAPERVDFINLFSEIKPNDQGIEWEENNIETRNKSDNNEEMDEVKVPECTSGGDEGNVEWEDASWLDASEGTNGDALTHEKLTELEAAELEEAIRRSLEDYGARRASKLVIKDAEVIESRIQQETPCKSAFSSAINPETSFLFHERERKGKAILAAEHIMGKEMQDKASMLKNDGTAVTLNEGNYDQFTLEENTALKSTFESCDAQQTIDSSLSNDSNGKQANSLLKIERKGDLNTSGVQEHIQGLSDSVIESFSVRQGTNNMEMLQNHVEVDSTVEHIGVSSSNKDSEEILRNDKKPDTFAAGSLDIGVESEFISQGGQTDDPRVECRTPFGLVQMTESLLEDALLNDAKQLDQEQFTQKKQELLAERESLCRQAQLEEEHAVLQSSLQEERDRLLEEVMELRASQQKNQRNAESVSGEMFSECQELLQMFGLPYIIAPMEAEAQCAIMDSVGLVDGVVTDDCDVFLFGGRNVYKNIFDDRKYVETYYMKDIEAELGLDQKKLIHMALLLGSDYTEGISGIGIVNAIEVVNAFGGESGLQKFREWLDAPDLTLLDKIPGSSKKQTKKKMIKEGKADEDESDLASEKPETSNYDHRQQNFMEKHRAVSKNWSVPESFPNPMVVNAYLSPQVDQSTESFAWGRPDLEALRKLCFERFGWNKIKSDELLLPVLKEYDRHETQLRLEAFYSFNQRFAKIRSKRVQNAVTQVTGFMHSELMDIPEADGPAASQMEAKRMRSRNGSKKKILNKEDIEGTAGPNIKKCQTLCNTQGPVSEYIKQDRQKGRGKGQAKGGRGTVLRGTRKRQSIQRADRSFTDESSSEDLQDGQLQDGHPLSRGLRRSARVTKRPTYTFSGSDDEDNGRNAENKKSEFESTCTSDLLEDDEIFRIISQSVNIVEDANAQMEHGYHHATHKNDTEMKNITINDLTSSHDPNYLHTGGGFCASGDEHDQNHNDHVAHKNDTEMKGIKINDLTGSQDPNHLHTGGGFCASGDEHDQNHNDHAAHKNDTEMKDITINDLTGSQEPNHLYTGGGFCACSDEHDQNHNDPSVLVIMPENNEAHVIPCEESSADHRDGFGSDDKIEELLVPTTGQPSTGNELKFRAIPLLRRKRQRTK